jgi:FtsH-binding integral membrane protein
MQVIYSYLREPNHSCKVYGIVLHIFCSYNAVCTSCVKAAYTQHAVGQLFETVTC